MSADPTYRLGQSIFDPARGTLHRDGQLVLPRPKTFKLLTYLARNPGRVLSKNELFDAVWPSTTVTEDSLTQCVRDARKCIGDEDQRFIRTLPRRGYMFQPLSEAEAGRDPVPASNGADAEGMEPRIVVLPFRILLRDAAQRALFEDIPGEIALALSCFRTIRVLPGSGMSTLEPTEGQEIPAAPVALGADFVVEGHVEGGDPLFNVVISLTGAPSARRLWTQIFSFDREAAFEFRHTLARRVATALVFSLENEVIAPGPRSAPARL